MILSRIKHISLLILLAAFCTGAYAQKVSFEVSAPTVVAQDEVFKLVFSVNEKPEEFNAPNITDFEILAGPSESTSSNISIVNGSMESSYNYSITYVLRPVETGKKTIPEASMTVNGKTYRTKSLSIDVVQEGQSSAGTGQQTRPGGAKQSPGNGQTTASSASISSEDIFLRAVVDKTTVFKGQPVRVQFKLYNRNVNIAGSEASKLPAFNGFWSQEINVSGSWQRETYNNKVYETQVLKEYLLYPQQSGTLTIEQFDITLIARIITQNRHQSLLDDFFGGGPEIQQVRKRVASSPISIKVEELPQNAPAGFNGAVGSFTMTADYPAGTIQANTSATYTVKISGTGNLSLIPAPKLEMPSSFEQYPIKTTESIQTTAGGLRGYRQFEYPFIPRAEGKVELEPVVFSYFDPAAAKYVTLKTNNIQINITADSTGGRANVGLVSGLTKEDLKILDQDIRFIKIGSSGLVSKNSIFFGSAAYWIILIAIIILFVLALIYLRKRIKEMKNSALMRGKKANKVALQRLRAAEKHMKEGNSRGFYDEMLKALWGYMSDKLNIPVSLLNKENMREELNRRSIAPESVNRFIDLISSCEYAQYSPEVSGQMNETYRSGVEIISKLESQIKK